MSLTAIIGSMAGVFALATAILGWLLSRSYKKNGRLEALLRNKEDALYACEQMLHADIPRDRDDVVDELRNGTF